MKGLAGLEQFVRDLDAPIFGESFREIVLVASSDLSLTAPKLSVIKKEMHQSHCKPHPRHFSNT